MNELGWESTSPRGRLFLAGQVLSGESPLTDEVRSRIDQCLLCRNCTVSCPLGTPIDQVIMAFRNYVAKEVGIPKSKKVLLNVLANQQLLKRIAPVASFFEHIPFRETPSGGATFRLNGKFRILPMMGSKPLLNQVQLVEAERPKRKVAYFVGCFTNYMGINVGRSVINVLTRNGCSVYLPPGQECCGVPYFSSGQVEKALSMVRKNINVLFEADVDAIVYSCGSCGTGLKEWAQLPELGDEYVQKAKELEQKTFEIGEYLIDQLQVNTLPSIPKKVRVTYHDSCHLSGSGVKEQPRRLLKMIDNLDYVEMPDANTCCGMGGLFSVTHYDLSRKINDRKINNILDVDPHVVTSGCPGCNLHIMDGLNKAGSELIVNHYIELVSNAYDCSD